MSSKTDQGTGFGKRSELIDLVEFMKVVQEETERDKNIIRAGVVWRGIQKGRDQFQK